MKRHFIESLQVGLLAMSKNSLLELLVDLVPFSVLRGGSTGLREELQKQSGKSSARKSLSYL